MHITLSYEDFTKSSQSRKIMHFQTATNVPQRQIFSQAIEALNESFAGMDHGAKYKTEHCFLPAQWARMGDGLKRCIGMCLSYLTACELIPMEYANKPGATNKLFRLKPGIEPSLFSFSVR